MRTSARIMPQVWWCTLRTRGETQAWGSTSLHLVAVAIRPGGRVQLFRGAHSHLWSVEAIVHGKRDRVAQDDSYHFVVPVLPLYHPDDRLPEGVLQRKEEKRPVIIETVVGPRARPLLSLTPPSAALCQQQQRAPAAQGSRCIRRGVVRRLCPFRLLQHRPIVRRTADRWFITSVSHTLQARHFMTPRSVLVRHLSPHRTRQCHTFFAPAASPRAHTPGFTHTRRSTPLLSTHAHDGLDGCGARPHVALPRIRARQHTPPLWGATAAVGRRRRPLPSPLFPLLHPHARN